MDVFKDQSVLIHYFKVSGYFFLLLGLTLWTLENSLGVIGYWSIVLMPFVSDFVLFLVLGHLLISHLFSSAGPSSLMYFLLYNFCLSSIGFLVLVGLKLDEVIHPLWSVVFILAWYNLLIYGAFCVFLMPGLMASKVNMRKELYLMLTYWFGLLCFTILLASYLDTERPEVFSVVMLPLVFIGCSHCSCMIYFLAIKARVWSSHEAIFCISWILFSGFILFREVKVLDFPEWVIVLPWFLCILHFLATELWKFEKKSPETQSLMT